MDIWEIEQKVREYLKKAKMSVRCVLVDMQIIEETDEYIEVVAHLHCKRTRKIRKVRIDKMMFVYDVIYILMLF